MLPSNTLMSCAREITAATDLTDFLMSVPSVADRITYQDSFIALWSGGRAAVRIDCIATSLRGRSRPGDSQEVVVHMCMCASVGSAFLAVFV